MRQLETTRVIEDTTTIYVLQIYSFCSTYRGQTHKKSLMKYLFPSIVENFFRMKETRIKDTVLPPSSDINRTLYIVYIYVDRFEHSKYQIELKEAAELSFGNKYYMMFYLILLFNIPCFMSLS